MSSELREEREINPVDLKRGKNIYFGENVPFIFTVVVTVGKL